MQYYENIVKKRNSCRGFSNKKVPEDVLADVRNYYDNDESAIVEGIRTELKFYSADSYELLKQHVGYNGICIKAPGYFVLYSEKGDHFIENAGYIAQGLTLRMAEHGVATCWMTIVDAAAVKKALNEDNGMEVDENPDMESFKKAVQPVYDQYSQYADYVKKIDDVIKDVQ